jgi:hypothetical protein
MPSNIYIPDSGAGAANASFTACTIGSKILLFVTNIYTQLTPDTSSRASLGTWPSRARTSCPSYSPAAYRTRPGRTLLGEVVGGEVAEQKVVKQDDVEK